MTQTSDDHDGSIVPAPHHGREDDPVSKKRKKTPSKQETDPHRGQQHHAQRPSTGKPDAEETYRRDVSGSRK